MRVYNNEKFVIKTTHKESIDYSDSFVSLANIKAALTREAKWATQSSIDKALALEHMLKSKAVLQIDCHTQKITEVDLGMTLWKTKRDRIGTYFNYVSGKSHINIKYEALYIVNGKRYVGAITKNADKDYKYILRILNDNNSLKEALTTPLKWD